MINNCVLTSRFILYLPTFVITEGSSLADVIKLFLRKSRFPVQPKQQEYSILKATNSFTVKLCLKIALCWHFCAGSDIRTNFIQFLILGKSRFPPKNLYNINYRWNNLMNNEIGVVCTRANEHLKLVHNFAKHQKGIKMQEWRFFTFICQDLEGIVAVPITLEGFIVKVKSLQSDVAST